MSNNNALNRLNLLKGHISLPTGSIDLEKERSNASFNVEHMNWLFCGSKEAAKALSDAYQMIQRDPDLYIPGGHSFDMTQPQQHRKTGQLLPGVTAGDIGAKYGRDVTEDGKYIPPKNPAIAYTTLIGERLTVLKGTQNALGRALTIACRYGCVRRQGADNIQIMDYQTHYVKLVPCVATIYVINIVDRNIKAHWEESIKLIQTNQSEFLKIVTDLHAISSGLKGTITWWGSEMLERCRRSLGGHAYSAYNAIGPAIGDWGVNTTEEGYFGKEQAIIVRNAYFGMCKELRKEIIPLVDAWGYPDFILQAPLGKFDGDVYKGIFLKYVTDSDSRQSAIKQLNLKITRNVKGAMSHMSIFRLTLID
ncbi:17044_t:CDS:2, partial [Racocetra fulgida]